MWEAWCSSGWPVSSERPSDSRAVNWADEPTKATKAETVRTALELMVRRARQKDAVKWFAEADALADLRDPKVKRAARS